MTERLNEAYRISHMLLFVLIALKWDGVGRLAQAPWWVIVMMSLVPVGAALLVEIVRIVFAFIVAAVVSGGFK